ncbi:carboxymuconolactone decarboxylase family protein [Conchiformibius steedae]|uniref:carboxymuconolactone decarboxylase family protein n=1 Tax=Conchiformibius steedae TaxID=153493 RepID=UPI0026F200D1|nr:carboxymuconolactone decarboxylase family protein [Conchiformibius steedae]
MSAFQNWSEHTAHVKSSFAALGKSHPKMLQAYGALEQAAAAEALDHKTRELIALAVAITTRCESCISVHAEAAAKAGATESEIAGALATAISLNAGAAYTYALRAIEAVKAQSPE